MRITMYDGSHLDCTSIYVTEKELIADDYRIVPIIEVQRIDESEEEE